MAEGVRRAIRDWRARLTERGRARFEVVAPADDRDLIRAAARSLAEEMPMTDARQHGHDVAAVAEVYGCVVVTANAAYWGVQHLDVRGRPHDFLH